MLKRKITKLISLLFFYPQKTFSKASSKSYWAYRRSTEQESLKLNNFQAARLALSQRFLYGRVSLLDVGSGDGSQIFGIQKTFPNLKLFACDSDSTYESLFASHPEIAFRLTSTFDQLSEFLTHASPQVITFFEVLEHIPDCEKYLLMSLDKASEGVLFSVPNTGYIIHRLRFLFGRTPCQWISLPSEHVRFWTLSDMKFWLFEYLGLTRSIITPYMGVPILSRFFPGLFCQGLFVYIPCR